MQSHSLSLFPRKNSYSFITPDEETVQIVVDDFDGHFEHGRDKDGDEYRPIRYDLLNEGYTEVDKAYGLPLPTKYKQQIFEGNICYTIAIRPNYFVSVEDANYFCRKEEDISVLNTLCECIRFNVYQDELIKYNYLMDDQKITPAFFELIFSRLAKIYLIDFDLTLTTKEIDKDGEFSELKGGDLTKAHFNILSKQPDVFFYIATRNQVNRVLSIMGNIQQKIVDSKNLHKNHWNIGKYFKDIADKTICTGDVTKIKVDHAYHFMTELRKDFKFGNAFAENNFLSLKELIDDPSLMIDCGDMALVEDYGAFQSHFEVPKSYQSTKKLAVEEQEEIENNEKRIMMNPFQPSEGMHYSYMDDGKELYSRQGIDALNIHDARYEAVKKIEEERRLLGFSMGHVDMYTKAGIQFVLVDDFCGIKFEYLIDHLTQLRFYTSHEEKENAIKNIKNDIMTMLIEYNKGKENKDRLSDLENIYKKSKIAIECQIASIEKKYDSLRQSFKQTLDSCYLAIDHGTLPHSKDKVKAAYEMKVNALDADYKNEIKALYLPLTESHEVYQKAALENMTATTFFYKRIDSFDRVVLHYLTMRLTEEDIPSLMIYLENKEAMQTLIYEDKFGLTPIHYLFHQALLKRFSLPEILLDKICSKLTIHTIDFFPAYYTFNEEASSILGLLFKYNKHTLAGELYAKILFNNLSDNELTLCDISDKQKINIIEHLLKQINSSFDQVKIEFYDFYRGLINEIKKYPIYQPLIHEIEQKLMNAEPKTTLETHFSRLSLSRCSPYNDIYTFANMITEETKEHNINWKAIISFLEKDENLFAPNAEEENFISILVKADRYAELGAYLAGLMLFQIEKNDSFQNNAELQPKGDVSPGIGMRLR